MIENTLLTADSFFALDDITITKITVPDSIPVWGGRSMFIKQLSRGSQDAYLQRQYGSTRMKQDSKAKNQEISSVNLYGHDAWLCVRGICNEQGVLIFNDSDIVKLNEKSGEAIGWVAREIVKFSGMAGDVKPEGELKNS